MQLKPQLKNMQIRKTEKDVCKGNAYSKGQKFDPSLWVSFRLQSEMMTYSIEYSHVSAFYVFLSLQMFKIYPHNVSFILCIEVLSESSLSRLSMPTVETTGIEKNALNNKIPRFHHVLSREFMT